MPAPRKSAFSSLASTSTHAELPEALLTWVRSLSSTRQYLSSSSQDDHELKVDSLEDLTDGVILSRILLDIDQEYFGPLKAGMGNRKALRENWVLRFNGLKRLYKLLIRYFEDVLSSSTTELHTPNLQLVAKGGETRNSETEESSSLDEVCKLIGLVLALAVQSERKLEFIETIQGLEEWVQRELMYSIEQVMSKVQPISDRDKTMEIDADSEFYQIQQEKSRLMHDKESLSQLYSSLLEDFNSLKEEHEEALSSVAAAEARALEAEKRAKEKEEKKNEQGLKAEMCRLRSELQSTSHLLDESEQSLSTQLALSQTLSQKVDELTPLANESRKLRDELDVLRHSSEKSKKLENVLEKYKKKIEGIEELKRVIKNLENENSELLDRTTSLTTENSQLVSLKPLVDSLKSKLSTSESKSSSTLRENERLKGELEEMKERLRGLEEERERGREGTEAVEERMRELELADKKTKRRSSSTSSDEDEGGVGGELDAALSGTTTTSLKLRIRQLERELKALQSQSQSQSNRTGLDSNRVKELEDEVEETRRLKERFVEELSGEMREKRKIERRLEEVMRGESERGDGPEANIALRQRLKKTTEDLESTRKRLAELETKFESQQRELVLARSDLSLVDQDKLTQLESLRASLSSETSSLSSELSRLKQSLAIAETKLKSQREEIEGLLREKIEWQGEGIEKRDRMLDARGSSEKDRSKLEGIEKENSELQAQVEDLQGKLQKTKVFIRSQDKLLKAELSAQYEETIQHQSSQISQLTSDLTRQIDMSKTLETNYQREHSLILSAWHDTSMRHLRQQVLLTSTPGSGTGGGTGGGSGAGEREYQPQSWIKQQRMRSQGKGLRQA
ncbi:uncharacterized protein JCM6883_004222 [Sporobolomyces salmoneus]|uniref:uncharacterized protein n=1 Tax=Sporobolomyces salmoneus TaxID=183962 RepID=UPI00317BF92B